jgi:hypothetical protein
MQPARDRVPPDARSSLLPRAGLRFTTESRASTDTMNPGTRYFIGPLTEAQRRRRERSRSQFQVASEIADARNISMREALIEAKRTPVVYWSPMRGDSYP